MTISDDIKAHATPIRVYDPETGETEVIPCLTPYTLATVLGMDPSRVRKCVLPLSDPKAVKDSSKRFREDEVHSKTMDNGKVRRMIAVGEAIRWAHHALGIEPDEDDLYISGNSGYVAESPSNPDRYTYPKYEPTSLPSDPLAKYTSGEFLTRPAATNEPLDTSEAERYFEEEFDPNAIDLEAHEE